jgi:hypothetical protein
MSERSERTMSIAIRRPAERSVLAADASSISARAEGARS